MLCNSFKEYALIEIISICIRDVLVKIKLKFEYMSYSVFLLARLGEAAHCSIYGVEPNFVCHAVYNSVF